MSWTDLYDSGPQKKRTDDSKKWRPARIKLRPVAGKPDQFVMESARLFARGEIDREELSYRLRFGHAKR